jgi:hypothetical protein
LTLEWTPECILEANAEWYADRPGCGANGAELQIRFTLPKTADQLPFQGAKFPDLLADCAELSPQQFAHVRTGFSMTTLEDE